MFMRTLAVLTLLAFASVASAGPNDTKVDIAITPFQADGRTFDKLLLDVETTPRFMQVHGMLFSSASSAGSPLTGTCLYSSGGGAFCTLSYGMMLINLTVQAAGNGSYEVRDAAGTVQVTGNAALVSIK